MIELKAATKNYGRFCAVKELSVVFGSGITGLLGQNGAGKTTTLNMLTGYFPPTSGSVLVDGVDLLQDPRGCKRKIGYLPEKPPLYDEMTVAEYLAYVARLREVPKDALNTHIDEIMQLCGIAERRNQLIGTLSKGYRQRVGIAQALCGDPQVLILDEPTVGLDPKQVTEIRSLIANIGQTHAVIFSSHNLHEVQQICTRALILHNGKLSADLNLKVDTEDTMLRLRLVASGNAGRFVNAVRNLPGVSKVYHDTHTHDGLIRLELTCMQSPEADLTIQEKLFRLCVATDTVIMELSPISNSLEETFLRITAAD